MKYQKRTISLLIALTGTMYVLNGMEKEPDAPTPKTIYGILAPSTRTPQYESYFFTGYEDTAFTDQLSLSEQETEETEIRAEAQKILAQLDNYSSKTECQKAKEGTRTPTITDLSYATANTYSSNHIILDISRSRALSLFDLDYCILLSPGTKAELTKFIQISDRNVLEGILSRSQDFILFTSLLSNTPLHDSVSSRLPALREIFLRASQIATCLAHINLQINQSTYTQATSNAIRADARAWTGLANVISLAYPNLHSAYALYANLLGIKERKFNGTKTGNIILDRIIDAEHLFSCFMIDMLRPYANAFLLSKNQALHKPLEWNRHKMPALIEKYLPVFLKVAQDRDSQFRKQRENTQSSSQEEEEEEEKQPKRRHRNRKQKKTNTNPTSVVSAPSNSQASAQQTTTASLDLPLPLPTTQALIATIIPSGAIAITPELAQTVPSTQEEEEEEEEEEELPKRAARKKEIEELRAQKEKNKEQKRQSIVNADKLIREQKARAETQKHKSPRLLALDETQRSNFNTYLKQKGLTNNPTYQAILKPRSSTHKVTQDHLDTFFRRLCDHLKEFLNQQEIGSPDDRSSFVAAVLRDLLGTRHNYHNRSEAEDLPHNYITHRRGPLIYAGLIPTALMEEVGKDNRRALEMLCLRLFSQAFYRSNKSKD